MDGTKNKRLLDLLCFVTMVVDISRDIAVSNSAAVGTSCTLVVWCRDVVVAPADGVR